MSPKRDGQPRRKISDTAKRRSILVFTEGKKTEPIYLTHWSRAYRENIIVAIDYFHGAPLSLVQEAAAWPSGRAIVASTSARRANARRWAICSAESPTASSAAPACWEFWATHVAEVFAAYRR